MRGKTCCFIGHLWLPKDKTGSIFLRLDEVIKELIQAGVTTFLSGGRMGFDKMAAALIAARKSRGDDVRLLMVLPYPGHEASWPENERLHLQSILSKADGIKYITDSHSENCVEQQDWYIAGQSAYCVCSFFNEESFAKMPVPYKSLHVINVTP